MRLARGLCAALVALTLAHPAAAADPLTEAQLAQLDQARASVANQVQLAAYDLVDELVYGWSQQPVFASPTPVVLASVSVPVGLGSGMQALLDNHVSHVLTQNPSTNVQLVHCPECTAVVVQSGPEGTLVSRGIDNPEVLRKLGEETGRHALFLDVEAEGGFLVLRARLTRLTPDLPIVWSHTIATSTSVPSMLREAQDLKSAAEAREEYLRVLRDRGPLLIPVRFAIRTYARGGPQTGSAPPFMWLQSGVELSPNDARAWTSSLLVGYSFIPQAYQGFMGQVRVSRLLTGRARSVTRPDLYAFVGGSAITVWGDATAAFRRQRLTVDEILTDSGGDSPRTTFGAFQVGLDARVGNRIGLSAFLETVPDLVRSRNIGEYTYFLGIEWHTLGTEVTFWF